MITKTYIVVVLAIMIVTAIPNILYKGAKFHCPSCDSLLVTTLKTIYPGNHIGSINCESVWSPGQKMYCPYCGLNSKAIATLLYNSIAHWRQNENTK